MNLKEQLRADTVEAMRMGDSNKRDTLRLMLAAIKQEEVDRRIQLDDSGVQNILTKQAKQRRESIADAENHCHEITPFKMLRNALKSPEKSKTLTLTLAPSSKFTSHFTTF